MSSIIVAYFYFYDGTAIPTFSTIKLLEELIV